MCTNKEMKIFFEWEPPPPPFFVHTQKPILCAYTDYAYFFFFLRNFDNLIRSSSAIVILKFVTITSVKTIEDGGHNTKTINTT